MTYLFSEAINRNIERTFTYAFVKYKTTIKPEEYDPFSYFFSELRQDPFNTFMELDGFQFKRTKNTLDKYRIPYTPEQERRARIYHDVVNKMQAERSDFVSMYVDDLRKTGIVILDFDSYILTTEKTIDLSRRIKRLPKHEKTNNVLYKHKLPKAILQTDEQLRAIETVLKHQISCLIGGAGTGKSFVTSAIIEQLAHNHKRVAILAPTHKARESLQEKLTTGTVRTVHSFVHAPTDCDVIVIDESGMLSTPLLHSLLKRRTTQQLIFVGDKNQLPPVEYGRPFELIQNEFTVAEITTNRRSESTDIIALGNEILGIPQNTNMTHKNIELVSTSQEAFAKGAEVALTYTNQNVQDINEQQRIKGGTPSICPHFKIGEELIATTNEKGRYYNGQLFTVVAYDRIRNKESGREVVFTKRKDLEYNFTYAYGLTIHKSQGSEWDVVAYQPSIRDTQNLAYVAVTRARKKLIIVGDELKNIYPPERKWRQLIENYSI